VVEPGQRRPGMDRVIEREISCTALRTSGIYKYTPATIFLAAYLPGKRWYLHTWVRPIGFHSNKVEKDPQQNHLAGP